MASHKLRVLENIAKELQQYFKDNLVVIILTISTILKSIYFSYQAGFDFSSVVLVFGIALVVSLMFLPILWIKKYKNICAFGLALFMGILILIDAVYFRYYSSLPTLETIRLAGNTNEISGAIQYLLSVHDAYYFLDLVIIILIFVAKKVFFRKRVKCKNGYQSKFRDKISLLISLVLITILSVGIWIESNHYLPFFINSAYDSKMSAERYGIWGAHIIDIYKSISFIGKAKLSDSEEIEIINWANKNIVKQSSKNPFTAVAKSKDVYLIQVESLEMSAINKKVNGNEITPNLNLFSKNSHNFTDHHSNIAMGNTSDTDLSVNLSMHPLEDAAAFMRYSGGLQSGLAVYMKDLGYLTTSFHGFNSSFWNRMQAFSNMGYQKSYFSEAYNNTQTVEMGINDKDFFKQSLDKIITSDKNNTPDFHYLITLSSHFPFTLPSNLKSNRFFDPSSGEGLNNYYQSINYADSALGDFLDGLKASGKYEDSLVIIYGDHAAKKGDLSSDQIASLLGTSEENEHYLQYISKRVPLMIKLPNQKNQILHNELSTNVDILPTILNLVGYEDKYISFGRDLFEKENSRFYSYRYYLNGLATDGLKLYFDPIDSNLKEGVCYSLNSESFLETQSEDSCDYLKLWRGEYSYYSSKIIKNNLLKEIISQNNL